MNQRIRVALLSLATVGMATALLLAQSPAAAPGGGGRPEARGPGAAMDAVAGGPADRRQAPAAVAGRSVALARPPARFHAPADGGPSPWSAGVHEVPGPDGSLTRVALRPDPAAALAEARGLDRERAALERDQAGGALPVTATILVLPVEFAGSARLDHLVHNADRTACVTVTAEFAGPLHGAIPYPGGSPAQSIDNQTVYYPSTEPEDYARLIFGRQGYTQPIRAGDPNVNGGKGVDISGLTVERYFEDQSDGHVVITGTVAPWVALDRPEAWYGLDMCIPNVSSRAIPDEQLGSLADMTIAAAEGLKAKGGQYASHDFWRHLDADDDGVVDSLWVLHAGRGQEYGGGSEGEASIWSRSADIAGYSGHEGGYVIDDGGTPDDVDDDIRLGPFTLMPEDSDIGVLIEEFGHSFFGLPDLYTNDAENSVGWWAPMSAGIWGGELGGTRPVNMPLWFRMQARCFGELDCGWANPVAALGHTTTARTVILGQAGTPAGGTVRGGAHDGETIQEGLRVDLPEQVEAVPNRAGAGGGAYTGADAGETLTLERELDLTRLPFGDGPVLQLGAFWNIPRYWGYLFVELAGPGEAFETLSDMDGRFSDENPFGLNEGWGLTGPGPDPGVTPLRFDLSEWRGKTVRLRLRYITYRGGPGTGVWLDDAALYIRELGQDLRFAVDDFEAGLGGWQASGWKAVPYTLHHPHHYLVEWRSDQGWDRSLRGAYQTSYHDQDEWRVDRVAANLPGALVMYRNLKYPFSGALKPQLADPPSWGAKYGLLVVDPHADPVTRPSGGPFNGALQSLDAALSLGRQPDWSMEVREAGSREAKGSESFSGQPGARRFDDAHGYAPGVKVGADGKLAPWDDDGGVVLPSVGGAMYSTRVVDSAGQPALERYGQPYAGFHLLGTGRPGDANLQFGVRLELVDQAPDGSWGAIRVSNVAMDYRLTASATAVVPGSALRLDGGMVNRGSVARAVSVTMEAWNDGRRIFDASSSSPVGLEPGESATKSYDMGTPLDAALTVGSTVDIIARFDDGDSVWERRLALPVQARPRLLLPMLGDGR